MEFSVSGILLDIEGTTSSIRFVYDAMFPFVRRELNRYLTQHWGDAALTDAVEQIAQDAAQRSVDEWVGETDAMVQQQTIAEHVLQLMDDDVKATGLKMLQGLIWKSGFQSGELVAHVYDDVVPAIKRWRAAGCDVRIYSSGSVQAQKLFFGHTEQGDLLPLFTDHYDTQIGAKRESASYQAIAGQFELPPAQILFLSDVGAELDAAAAAGLQTCLCIRPGNATIDDAHAHPCIDSFAQITLAGT